MRLLRSAALAAFVATLPVQAAAQTTGNELMSWCNSSSDPGVSSVPEIARSAMLNSRCSGYILGLSEITLQDKNLIGLPVCIPYQASKDQREKVVRDYFANGRNQAYLSLSAIYGTAFALSLAYPCQT